jgi:hypothetical protein
VTDEGAVSPLADFIPLQVVPVAGWYSSTVVVLLLLLLLLGIVRVVVLALVPIPVLVLLPGTVLGLVTVTVTVTVTGDGRRLPKKESERQETLLQEASTRF